MRRRRPDEGVDVVAGRLRSIAPKPIAVGVERAMRRVRAAVDLMLLGTVLLWALNITVTKYVLEHGFQPLAYATIRYFAATSLFWCFTLRSRALVPDRALATSELVLLAVVADLRQPDRLRLRRRRRERVDGRPDPRDDADLHRDHRDGCDQARAAVSARFWVAAALSFVGVGFVASGSGGFSAHVARRPARPVHRRDRGPPTR